MLDRHAFELVHEGFTVVPQARLQIPAFLIDKAVEASHLLIQQLAQLNCQTGLQREGEDEPDMLLVHRPSKEGKDIKYFLHYSNDVKDYISLSPELQEFFSSAERQKQLKTLALLHERINRLVEHLLFEVQVRIGQRLTLPLKPVFRVTCEKSLPYCTSTLRSLWYPEGQKTTGAKEHFDRALLTAHMGGLGGSLLGHFSYGDGDTFQLSPDTGEMLFFWGVKALFVSDGFLKPLRHSALAEPGKDRQALVQFNHVPYVYRVINAEQAFLDFCRTKNIEDPTEWYAKLWS